MCKVRHSVIGVECCTLIRASIGCRTCDGFVPGAEQCVTLADALAHVDEQSLEHVRISSDDHGLNAIRSDKWRIVRSVYLNENRGSFSSQTSGGPLDVSPP